jgi:superfamily II DNA/RNA helicase
VVASSEEKPLALLALLQQLSGLLTIVFTGSVRRQRATLRPPSPRFCSRVPFLSQVDTTHRLFLMLNAFEGAAPMKCVEYSSLQSHTERTRALDAFRTRSATVLVASDAATRGLDVEVRERVRIRESGE